MELKSHPGVRTGRSKFGIISCIIRVYSHNNNNNNEEDNATAGI